MESYSFSIRILDPAGTIMSFIDIPSSTRAEVALGKDSRLECTIENINLLPGEFYIDLVAKELAGPVIDSIPVAFSFAVTGDSEIMQRTENRGLIYLPADWRLVASESQRSGETDSSRIRFGRQVDLVARTQ